MTKDETLRLALDTLKEVREETFRLLRNGQTLYAEDKVWSTIISIQETLETKDEPVMVDSATMQLAESVGLIGPASRTHDLHNAIQRFHDLICANATIKAAVAFSRTLEAKDEPVAWGVFEGNLHDMFFSQEEAQEMADLKGTHAEVRPLYTTPTQRTWVGLTYDEETELIRLAHNHAGIRFYIQAAEAKLKEKNT